MIIKSLAAVALIAIFAATPALAAKEQFVRSKPHVNVAKKAQSLKATPVKKKRRPSFSGKYYVPGARH